MGKAVGAGATVLSKYPTPPFTTGIIWSNSRLKRRWVVERFFAWIGRNRRLAKDFEATLESARAFLYAASIMLLTRRLAQSG